MTLVLMPPPAYTVISHLYRKSVPLCEEGIGINPEAAEKTLRFQGKLRPRGLDLILWEMALGTMMDQVPEESLSS